MKWFTTEAANPAVGALPQVMGVEFLMQVFSRIHLYSSFFAPFIFGNTWQHLSENEFYRISDLLIVFFPKSSIDRCSANRFAGSLRFCPVSRSAFCCDAGATLGRIIHTRHRNPMGYVSFASLFQGSSAAFGYVDTPAGTPNICTPPKKSENLMQIWGPIPWKPLGKDLELARHEFGWWKNRRLE